MGTDNLHHKRKERTKTSLRRRRAQRDSYDVVLIVCEGSKTEPRYFCELRDDLGLNNFNVVVTGESGSDPDSVVQATGFLTGRQLQHNRILAISCLAVDIRRHPGLHYAGFLNGVSRFHGCQAVASSQPSFQ